jgi:hypothetical protein
MKIAYPNTLAPPTLFFHKKNRDLLENGYEIINCDNIAALNLVKKNYYKIAKSFGINGDLKSISKLDEKKTNQIHLKFNKESKNVNLNLINAFYKSINKYLDNNIYLQRQPYLRLKKYNLKVAATVPHNDYDFGHASLGFNLWTPLFDIKNNVGIYIYSIQDSKKIYKEFKFDTHLQNHIKKLKNKIKRNYINLNYGQAILFSNLCVHGASIINKKINRVSTNIHLQSQNIPMGDKGSELFTLAYFQKNKKKYFIQGI